MNRRLATLVAAVMVAMFAAYGTARAHQAWDEHQARGRLAAAHALSAQTLSRARAQGLPAAQVQGFAERLRSIARRVVPREPAWWHQHTQHYYDSQIYAYHRLAGSINASVHVATVRAREDALAAFGRWSATIGEARQLELPTGRDQSTLAADRTRASTDSSIADLRSLGAGASASGARLSAAVATRQRAVDALLQQAGGTHDGVVTLVQNQSTGGQYLATLVGLLHKQGSDRQSELTRALAAVSAAPDAHLAAIRGVAVHDLVTAINTEFIKAVPDKLIVVSTEDQSATLYQAGQEIYSTPVTTGGPELPTDHGIFHIYDKISPFVFHSPWPPDSPYYYSPSPVTYWMPFDGAEGLHDAPWRANFGPGSNLQPTDLGGGRTILGTHGCVNFPPDAATYVWNWAPVGTTVAVI